MQTGPGNHVLYDLDRDEAWFGEADGRGADPRLRADPGEAGDAALAAEVGLGPGWLMRCDRVDFPPAAVAYRHVHPGPRIRRLLHGSLRIEAPDRDQTCGPGGVGFEGADYPVLVTASASEETAFVRVLFLPPNWDKRTIRHLDPADDERPRLQRVRVFVEEPRAF